MFQKILNTFGTRASTAILNLLIAILLSQILGAEGKGVQGLIITTIAFILVFANLVGGATLVYLTPRYSFSLLIIPSYIWSLLIGILSYLFLLVFPVVDEVFAIHIAILAVVNSFVSIHSSLLIGKEKINTSNFINLIVPLATLLSLAIIFFVTGEKTIHGYITSLYIAYGIAFFIGGIYIIRIFGIPKIQALAIYFPVLGELYRYGFLNQIAHITQMLSFRLSYYILDGFHGEASVGIYSNAIALAESIWLVSKSISLVQYARISNTDDQKYAATLTTKLIKASLFLSLVLIVPLLLFPESFYQFVFGNEFGGVRYVILALSPGVVLYSFSILSGHYFSGRGKYHVNAIVSTIGLLVSIAVYYIFIPAYAERGAGMATSISYTFTSLVITIWFMLESRTGILAFLPSIKDYRELISEIRKLTSKK